MSAHVSRLNHTKISIESDLRGTDGETTVGTLETTIESSGSGGEKRVQMTTSGGVYSLSDASACAELLELASDMIAHWGEVKKTLEEVAGAIASESEGKA